MIFDKPEINSFFDNRLIVSWTIVQPKELPPLKKMLFKITGEPKLVFEPNQTSVIELPELENNTVILNWVIMKPNEKTELTFSVSCPAIEEKQRIAFNP